MSDTPQINRAYSCPECGTWEGADFVAETDLFVVSLEESGMVCTNCETEVAIPGVKQ